MSSQIEEQSEDEDFEFDYAFFRNYYEQGCLCIVTGYIETVPKSVPDVIAYEYYDKNCCCS